MVGSETKRTVNYTIRVCRPHAYVSFRLYEKTTQINIIHHKWFLVSAKRIAKRLKQVYGDLRLKSSLQKFYDHYHELVDLCAVSFHLRTLELYRCTWSMLSFCGGDRVAHSLKFSVCFLSIFICSMLFLSPFLGL